MLLLDICFSWMGDSFQRAKFNTLSGLYLRVKHQYIKIFRPFPRFAFSTFYRHRQSNNNFAKESAIFKHGINKSVSKKKGFQLGLTVSFFLVSRNTKLYETGHCFAEFRSFRETENNTKIRKKGFRVVSRNLETMFRFVFSYIFF